MQHDMQINLIDILKYKRQHGSATEAAFINHYLIPVINELGYKPKMDMQGNVWVEVESKDKAPYLFCAHIDTCHRGEGMTTPVMDEQGVISVHKDDIDGCCLGADDGVGIYCNLRLIEAGVAGTYLFTRGEECGGIGAEYIAKETPDKLEGFLLCVEVDRAGTDEIIMSQSYGDCASVEFSSQLGHMLGMGHEPSQLGVYTDCAEFGDIIPESVNISAGYDRQHTVKETVNTIYVENLVERLIGVDWSELVIVREPGDTGPDWWDTEPATIHEDYSSWKEDRTMEDYVFYNPQTVAQFLVEIGVDVAEIEETVGGSVSQYEDTARG